MPEGSFRSINRPSPGERPLDPWATHDDLAVPLDTLRRNDADTHGLRIQDLQRPDVRRRLRMVQVGIRAVEPGTLRRLFTAGGERPEAHVFRGSLATQCRTLVRLGELLNRGRIDDPIPEIPGLLHALIEDYEEHAQALRTLRTGAGWAERELLDLLEAQLAAADALFPAETEPRERPPALDGHEIRERFQKKLRTWESK